MSNENLQQAADQEHGNTPPSLLKVVGLVFVVAFVLLLFSFLMELRGNEEESQTLASVIEERQALREQVIEQEARIGALEGELAQTKAAAEIEWEAMDEKIRVLKWRIEELTRKTTEKVRERAAEFGLTLGQVADMNEVRLSSLVKQYSRFEIDYYYDRANRCYYGIATGEASVAEAVVVGYMSELSRFFDNPNGEDAIWELDIALEMPETIFWSFEPEGAYFCEQSFEMDGKNYLFRIHAREDYSYDGFSLFELVLVT